MKKKKVIIICSAIAIILFIIIGVNSVKRSGTSAVKGEGQSVQYILPTTKEAVDTFNSKGFVTVKESEEVYAINDGKIGEMLVEVGDTVNVGDTLFTYDEQYLEDLQDSLEDAKLNLQIAQTNLSGYRSNLNNIDGTVDVRQVEVLSYESQVQSAKNVVEDYNKQLETLSSDIEKANTSVEEAKEEYDKQEILYKNGLISLKELESFEDIVESAEDGKDVLVTQKETLTSNIERANYSLEVANKNLHYAKNPESIDTKQQVSQAKNSISIGELNVKQAQSAVEKIQEEINVFVNEQTSTVEGVVTKINVANMTNVTKGSNVLEITNMTSDNYKVVLSVEQKNAYKLKEGLKVIVTSSGIGDEKVNGYISKVMPEAKVVTSNNGQSSFVDIEVSFKEDLKGLKNGFTVDGEVIVKHFDDAVVIPILSIGIDENGENYIYVIKDDNTLEKRFITIGVILGSEVQVDNVTVDEKIVTSNIKRLNDGDKVNPIEEE